MADTVTVPPGYSVAVVCALGDPLRTGLAAYSNDGTDGNMDQRIGDHADGMCWYGLSASGQPSSSVTDRGLLAMNHEATTDSARVGYFLHANGGTTTLPRPAAEIDKEMAVHGVSVVEVVRTSLRSSTDGTSTGASQTWGYDPGSVFNRRITPLTPADIHGPARGDAQMITRYSPTGLRCRGTLNNCGTGKTPWGSLLTGEENWAGYFFRPSGDDAARGNGKAVTALRRYGRTENAGSRHGWETGGASSDDRFARWNHGKLGSSTDGSDDYRHEMNTFGYIVEIDPYDPSSTPRKRTALGRFAHESAAISTPVAGQPLAFYMGDDARNEYIYKFVSAAPWDAADASPADRLATGSKYLDSGTLYVAQFAADGTGIWVPLVMTQPALAASTSYPFANQADICINTRLAGDVVGATKMDRPEWCAVHPQTGEVYYTLTNNSFRRAEPGASPQLAPDAANPRVYTDLKGSSTQQTGNPNGHILRLRESGDSVAATTFRWDVYLFGAESGAASTVNLSALSADQDFSSPDGIAFAPSTGLCWIQTDDSAYTDVSNCMMLAAVPGRVGDGGKQTLSYSRSAGGTLAVDTFVGATPTAQTLKRFLVGPVGCEITGLCETPDGKALFINIQHPGEGTARTDIGDPTKYLSQWPARVGYGRGLRPRTATIVITKDDGGRIGT